MVQQIVIWGIMNGAIYAMLALGFTFMFGVARVINMAQGAFFMVSAYLMYIFISLLQLNILLSIALTIILAGAIGVIAYQLLIRRIEEYHGAVVLMTVAVALVLQEIILVIFGGEYLSTEPFIPGAIVLLGIDIRNQYLLSLGVVSVCLVGTGVFLYKTRTGLAIRSVAQDREIANVMGINVERTYLIAMGLGAFLAGIAGALIAPIYTLSPTMGWHPLVIMLAVVVLGGLGSIKGSVIGAFILAFVEVTVVFLVPMGSFLKDAVALTIVIAVLLTRPEGLFGIAFEGERL
jgi:branched-chain amino acid transport system permease protein